MYGLIGSFDARPGERDAIIALIKGSGAGMPGCLSYVIATDPADADRIWVSEVWESEAAHKASLALPAVKAAIEQARPLIAAFGEHRVTTPVAVLGGAGAP